MAILEIHVPTRIITGPNVVNRLPEIIPSFGERVLIVTDKKIEEFGFIDKIKKLVESKVHGVIVYDEVTSLSGVDVVDDGILLARESKVDVVIGLGGANTLNVAKAIAHIAGNDGYTEDYFAGRIAKKKKIAYIEIPTTHGINYGLLDAFYIRDNNDDLKREYRSKINFADVVLADPTFTKSLPNKFVVALSVELLAHAFDSYLSKRSTLLTEAYATMVFELVGANIKKAVLETDNVQVRQNLSQAGIMASLALNSSRPGIIFALTQPLYLKLGLYHGIGSCILLPHVMEYNLTSSPGKYVKIAKALGENVADISVVEAAIKAVEAIRKILFDLNVPQRLNAFDVDEEKFHDVVRDARTFDFLNVLPRVASYDDLLNILISAH